MSSHRTKKSLGQHFLVNAETIATIVAAINPADGERIVEIGPGDGVLTQALLKHNIQLNLLEIDRDLIPRLQARFGHLSHANIHHENALRSDYARFSTATDKIRLVGNLPYNISTPLLFHVLEFCPHITDFHFMLQREVVNRICATVGERSYNRLSIAIQNVCEVEYLFDIPPEHFRPPPKVHSSFLRMTPRNTPLVNSQWQSLFQQVTKAAFNQARKTIRNSLKSFVSASEMETLGIDPNIRPQYVSIQQFQKLTQAAAQHSKS